MIRRVYASSDIASRRLRAELAFSYGNVTGNLRRKVLTSNCRPRGSCATDSGKPFFPCPLVRRSVSPSISQFAGPSVRPKHFHKQDPEVNDASSSHFFIFHFFYNFFIFSFSSSLLPPRPSFLLVPPFFLFPFESIKGHVSSILTKA